MHPSLRFLLPLALFVTPGVAAAGHTAAHQDPTAEHEDHDDHDEDSDHPRDAAPLEAPGGVQVAEQLEVHAWAGAGYSWHRHHTGEHAMGPDVRMARIGARVHYDHQGDIFAQLEAADGTARLLDARVTMEVGDHVEFRAGRMKTSTSAEFLIPLPIFHHVNRARLVEWVPQRQVGVEAVVTPFAPGFDLQAGIFNVAGTEAVEGAGALFVGRMRFEPLPDLQLHASWTDHLESEHSDPDYSPEHDQLADVAVELDHNNWIFHIEAIARFDDTYDHGRGIVTFGSVGYHVGHDPEGFSWEPVVAVDHIIEEVGVTENVAAGLNIYVHGHKLMQLTEVEYYRLPDGETDLGVFVQLRGGV